MGGVYVFDSSDATSILQNPAYSCFTEGFNWTMFNMGFGINGLQIYSDLQSIGAINGISSLAPLYGKNVWLGGGGNSTMTFPCFGFSVYGVASTGFRLSSPPFPFMEFSLLNDYAFLGGFAVPISPILSVGLNLKRTTRQGGATTIGATNLISATTSTLTNAITNKGNGYGADLGVVARLGAAPFNPTFSLNWKDIGSTQFIKTGGTDSPDRLKDNLIGAVTFDGSIPGLGVGGGLEYRHITDTGEPWTKKIHLGLELNLLFVDLRAGFYQGYTTYGLGVDLLFLQLDVASYSVEKGAYAGQTEDKRIQVALSTTISFDPSFNLVALGANGKGRRKVKQRR